jgi:type IX secretion system substrate protein/galactose oxidase-like protein
MKKIITAFVFCILCGECFSQAGEWVWLKGDSVPNQPGNYGVQGVPSPTNNPPSLYEPCEWTDLNGNFWLFGGHQFGGPYNALWKYDPVMNIWTWMKGSDQQDDTGHYGAQGIASILNNPPSRGWGIVSWTDNQNNLWLFGGYGDDTYNDLWRYNIPTNEWTWMKGSNLTNQYGSFGTQGIPAPSNTPGSTDECAAAWTDDNGNLWFFGGSRNANAVNHLWRYNITTNEWTWMKGSIGGNQGYYGSAGVEDSMNTPGARWAYTHWKDDTGKLWVFGGYRFNYGYYNDLWRFNPLTNNWAWMSGDTVPYSQGLLGNYGSKCVPSILNTPGARLENRAVCTDPNDNFWLFGGGIDTSTSLSIFDYVFNDLWLYSISMNKWVWVSGDSIPNLSGNWGTIGISNPANKPFGRGGGVGWSDSAGRLYFFGGMSGQILGFYNDLWKFVIDTSCISTSIAENNLPKADELLVFPNPANSSLTISFSSSGNQTIELRIYNTLGKQVSFFKEKITKGKFEKEINVEKWSGGIYFLQVKTKEGMISKKVIVNHP